MKQKRRSELGSAALLLIGLTAVSSVAGCGRKEAEITKPAEIKAAMGGHYSPEILAEGRAAQARDMQRNAQMAQTRGSASPMPTASPGSHP